MNVFAPITVLALAASSLGGSGRLTPPTAEDLLARSRAAYAALASYADSGTVLDETSGFTDRATFRTFFDRAPRNLLIEFRAVASEYKSGYRLPLDAQLVIWMVNGNMQTWSSRDQAHGSYPADGGQQVSALKNAGYYTKGASLVVPSHLYSKSGLISPVHATDEATADGFETVNGRRCHRIKGVERYRYPSGQETGVRAITIWIDAETFLIHKILQDTPKGYPRNEISRRTTTIKYRANPKLEPAYFSFKVPTS
jgi:hypothetical protein